MKSMKRAERRHKKRVKFIKRLKNWVQQDDEVREAAMRGECLTFLRTTGRPCNCYMCSTYRKFKRTSKQKIKKEIWKQISE